MFSIQAIYENVLSNTCMPSKVLSALSPSQAYLMETDRVFSVDTEQPFQRYSVFEGIKVTTEKQSIPFLDTIR